MSDKHLLAIPVFNEERHVLSVLREAGLYSTDILVIDDGSTDSTPKLLADASASVIRHRENRGYGASLASAFAYARQNGYRRLITMDCDQQHEPSFIPQFMATMDTGDHDIVSGSRYMTALDGDDTPPPDRRRINARITTTLNDRLSLDITDAFCGFKAYRVAALRSLRITVPGYAMPMQFWVQVWRARLRVAELPVTLIYNDPDRHFGGSLDDPASRYEHYLDVFESEMRAEEPCIPCPAPPCGATVA